jgi:pyruvate dehydrogenase E2 component (dihydrolipoamide acetyltransferase)
MQNAINFIEDLKKNSASRKIDAPTITDLILWGCGKTLPQFPYLHGSWTEKGALVNPEINLGLVVGLDDGLIVPILHHADQLSLFALTTATRKLKQKAKQGGLSSSDLTGGTFTVSNLGMFGVSSFIAVINPPESAVLALGAIIKRPVVDEKEKISIRPILTATLSVDHRLIDGIMAAKFLKAIKEVLESPSLLLFEK